MGGQDHQIIAELAAKPSSVLHLCAWFSVVSVAQFALC